MAVTFTKEMIDGAIATEKETGVPASITLGQLVLESGYKSPSSLSGLAKNYNNYFGVTKGSWSGQTVLLSNSKGQDTKEYRVYDSVADSFTDHAKIFQAERYQQYFRNAKSVDDYAKGIQAGGYATDTKYAEKLLSVIKSNNLTQYDGKSDTTENVYAQIDTSLYTGAVEPTSPITLETSVDNGFFSSILSTVIVFVVLFTIGVVGVVSFMKAFNISIPNVKTFAKGK